jgi:hypothetical protein
LSARKASSLPSWDVVHELVGLLADFMLVYSFSNDGCQSLGSSLAGLEGQMQHHR